MAWEYVENRKQLLLEVLIIINYFNYIDKFEVLGIEFYLQDFGVVHQVDILCISNIQYLYFL